MSVGLKANADGSGAIQVGGTDAITLSTGLNATFVQNADLPNTFGFKNRIINGAMVIDQRNAGASVTGNNSVFSVDRWGNIATQSSKYTIQQNAASVTPPVGFKNYLGVTSSSAYSVLTGDAFCLLQGIEGYNVADLAWGTASAATVTLSFWVRSSLTGTFGGSLANSGGTRSYPFTYTINSANTWEKETITIAGDTSGTWLTTNGAGIYVYLNLGAGTTFSGTAGAWAGANYTSATGATSVIGTAGATFYITGVQLEKGTTATSFDFRDYGRELALCQRYYYRIAAGVAGQIFGPSYNSTTVLAPVTTTFPVPLRIAPSAVEQSGTASDYRVNNLATTTLCNSVPTFNVASTNTAFTLFNTAATLTAGQGSAGASVNTNAYLGWSAEL
jgi:hypothetical protein